MKRTQLHEGQGVRTGRRSRTGHDWTSESVIVSLDRDFSTAAQHANRDDLATRRGYRNNRRIDNTLIAVAVKDREGNWNARFVSARKILFTQDEHNASEIRKDENTKLVIAKVAERITGNEPVAFELNEFLNDEVFALEDNGRIGLINNSHYTPVMAVPSSARKLVDTLLKGLELTEVK